MVSGAFKKIADENESSIEDRLEKLGERLSYAGPEEYNKALRMEHERLKAIFKEIKMETTK